MEKEHWCSNCQAVRKWTRVGESEPVGGSWFKNPAKYDLFECQKCKQVKPFDRESNSQGWS